MPTPITMPQLAETVTEGTISRWMKSAGEKVKRYEPLVEIMTDKVNVEMTSPVSGVLLDIIAGEGETIPVGGLLANIAEEAGEALPERRPEALEGRRPEALEGALEGRGALPPASPPDGAQPPPPAQPERHPERSEGPPRPERSSAKQRLTPVVARLAQQHNIDVSQLTGTGIDGRVTKQDLLKYIETRDRQPKTDGAQALPPVQPAVGGPITPDEDTLPITPLRRAIADNMLRSKTTAPHAWSMVEVDVSQLVRWRESIKEDFRKREGVDLTYLPFFVKVVAEALRQHPSLNASWAGDRIILKRRINIGLAVNRDEGLIVPVLKDADRLSVTGLAHAVAGIVARARNNTLKPEDVSGGTFTLNNTGALGVTLSYPIMVPGQAAIVTTEAIVKRPVVVEDAIAIRSIMNMAIAFDHRITDGGVIGSFLRTVKSRLESLGPNTPLS